MKLFNYESYKVVISEEALLISPFRKIWQRDTSEDKEMALSELGFIYFFVDPRSDFMFLLEDDLRREEIIKQEGLPDGWQPDEIVEEGIKVYSELTNTTSSLTLKDIKEAIEKARTFLKNIDFTDEDKNGKVKYPMNMVTAALDKLIELSKKVHQTEKDIAKEIEEEGRLKGQRIKTLLDDGFKNFKI